MTEKRFHLRNAATTAILAVVLVLSVGTITAQVYHPADIKAINSIIANNGLAWTTAAPIGSIFEGLRSVCLLCELCGKKYQPQRTQNNLAINIHYNIKDK